MSVGQPLTAVVLDASTMVEVLGGDVEWIAQMERWLDADALLLAPPFFGLEVANALLRGLRLSAADAITRLGHLIDVGIEPVDRGPAGLFDAIELAEKHGLTVYDAA